LQAGVVCINSLKNLIMKKRIIIVCFAAFMATGFTGYAQVYKTVQDTVKLNKEYTEVMNDIATLTAKLAVAENNMPGVQSKAVKADAHAQEAAVHSSEQATKAVDGGVKEAKKAKRESKKAYHKAKDAKSATNDISEQNEKIASLKGELAKKQERLEQLTAMRNSINSLNPSL
jgi:chromosome segregation ATPase